jgi:hypothetical protein
MAIKRALIYCPLDLCPLVRVRVERTNSMRQVSRAQKCCLLGHTLTDKHR